MRFLSAVFLLTIATAAIADNGTATCAAASDYAKTIMEARQNGVPASEVVKGADLLPPGSRDIALFIMINAYKQPQFDQTKEQQDAINSFGDGMFAECMKSH